MHHFIAPDAFQLELATNHVSGGRSAEAGTFYANPRAETLKGQSRLTRETGVAITASALGLMKLRSV